MGAGTMTQADATSPSGLPLSEAEASTYEAMVIHELWRYRYAMTRPDLGWKFLSMKLAGEYPDTSLEIAFQHGRSDRREIVIPVWGADGKNEHTADAYADALHIAIMEGQ